MPGAPLTDSIVSDLEKSLRRSRSLEGEHRYLFGTILERNSVRPTLCSESLQVIEVFPNVGGIDDEKELLFAFQPIKVTIVDGTTGGVRQQVVLSSFRPEFLDVVG